MNQDPKLNDYVKFDVQYFNRKTRTLEVESIIGQIKSKTIGAKDDICVCEITTNSVYCDNYAILVKNNSNVKINRTFVENWQICDKQGNLLK